MATTRARQAVPGTTQWVQEEKDHARGAVASEIADFGFSIRNEMEWLNEKMSDIFSRDPKTLTDVLKTPGKLRGKTPRTIRMEAPTARQPLADIFAPILNASATPVLAEPKDRSGSSAFKVIEDVENPQPYTKPASRSRSPQRVGKAGNTDSGYHGMTEDETDPESRSHSQRTTSLRTLHPVENAQQPPAIVAHTARHGVDDTNRSTDESFQSAREDMLEHRTGYQPMERVLQPHINNATYASYEFTDVGPELEPTEVDTINDIADDTEIAKPSQRKSSFNFSSLPAREPLHAKKSLGGRTSYMESNARTSMLAKAVRNASGTSVVAEDKQSVPADATESLAKSSAQRLHERITMLGKSREPRASTIMATASQDVAYPSLPQSQPSLPALATRDLATETSHASSTPKRPAHQKHMSVPDFSATPRMEAAATSPAQKAMSLYEVPVAGSTPNNVPRAKKPSEGPLSASKNRLMSVLKSARSIFASSASASAAAKLEAHDTSPDRQAAVRDISNGSSTSAAVMQMPGALYPDTRLASGASSHGSDQKQHAQEKDLQAQLQAEANLDQAREQQRIQAAEEDEQQDRLDQTATDREQHPPSDAGKARPNNFTASTKVAVQPAGKLKSVGRPVRPVKESAVPKPAPVNIKVGSQLKALQEPYSRPSSIMRPASALSTIKNATSTSTNSRTRALEAANRKKDLEEREKQRKVQQKKELERKRLAKAEEEQKAEMSKKTEEQKQAQEEAKRQQLRAQQQRQAAQKREEDAQRAKAALELAETIQKERAQQQAQTQANTGTLRQLTSKTASEHPGRPPVNPAKPPKRALDLVDSDHSHAASVTATYQQNDGKRRKTDEKVDGNQRVSVMGPPKRPSTIRKETITRFPLGYTATQPHATHQPTGMFKSVVNNQHQMQQSQRQMPAHPSQTVQVSTARIAFADGHGPAVALPSGHPASDTVATQPGKFKTPVRPAQMPVSTAKSAKSSPMFNHGDAIALPDIATDSEEEDDEDEEEQGTGFRAPSWVASPALRELLTQQQLVDPESVFGPIGELKMEEVFRGAKNAERLKKFRDRGSSAAWIQNGDAVTSAEKRRDMQMRERVAREGGWRYEPGL